MDVQRQGIKTFDNRIIKYSVEFRGMMNREGRAYIICASIALRTGHIQTYL